MISILILMVLDTHSMVYWTINFIFNTKMACERIVKKSDKQINNRENAHRTRKRQISFVHHFTITNKRSPSIFSVRFEFDRTLAFVIQSAFVLHFFIYLIFIVSVLKNRCLHFFCHLLIFRRIFHMNSKIYYLL